MRSTTRYFSRRTMPLAKVMPAATQVKAQDKATESRKTDLKRVIAGMGEFQGLPLARQEPRSNEDFEFKLKGKFDDAKVLLNFFEKNRDKFRKEEHFTKLFLKLSGSSLRKDQLYVA